MLHHWLPLRVANLRNEALEYSQPISVPNPKRRRNKRRKSKEKYMGLVLSSCIVFVLGLIALKLIAAGLTATLLGVGILNLSCVLGGLVSWEEERSETKRARRKAPVGVTAAPVTLSGTLGSVLSGQDRRFPSLQPALKDLQHVKSPSAGFATHSRRNLMTILAIMKEEKSGQVLH